jgi:hypothetical protein
VIALLPEAGCPPPDAMLALVDAKLAELAEESKRLETQLRRLVETRRYLARRAKIEASRGGICGEPRMKEASVRAERPDAPSCAPYATSLNFCGFSIECMPSLEGIALSWRKVRP